MSFVLLGILNAQAEAAGAGSYDLLETQILSSSASSVTFTGLGSYSDYKHLQIRMTARTDRAAEATESIKLQFNSDTGSNYAAHFLTGDGSSVDSLGLTNREFIFLVANATNATANAFSGNVVDILDFSSTSKNTTVRDLEALDSQIRLNTGFWNDTSAVTSIDLTPQTGANLLTGCRFSLYGIKAA